MYSCHVPYSLSRIFYDSIIARSFNLNDGTHIILFLDLFLDECFVRSSLILTDSTPWDELRSSLLGSKGPVTIFASLSFFMSSAPISFGKYKKALLKDVILYYL